MELNSKILVTGSKGMAGAAIVRKLKSLGYSKVSEIDKHNCNLLNGTWVDVMFSKCKFDYVFHVAAKVGGIHANDVQSGDFIYENLMMQCNVIEASKKYKVKKLVFCGSACIYPKYAKQPIAETELLSGYLEKTNKAYAIAKIAGIEMCQAYRKQYGCNFISAMPTNLYGPGDNFSIEDSHVLPALLRRFYESQKHNYTIPPIWGTGNAKRELLYVDDLADALVFLMSNYNEAEPINIGTGKDISIIDLVYLIKKITGVGDEILFDMSYPDGVPERRLDVTKINNLGWFAPTDITTGITKTWEWFLKNYENARK